MQTVKNITSIKYFLDLFETVDDEYSFDVKYHEKAPKTHFRSLPTFIAEFNKVYISYENLKENVLNDVSLHDSIIIRPTIVKHKHKQLCHS